MIAALAFLAAALGLLWLLLYRDNAFVTTSWNGNDAVTLILAVPLPVLALWFARGGSSRALFLWLGMLDRRGTLIVPFRSPFLLVQEGVQKA